MTEPQEEEGPEPIRLGRVLGCAVGVLVMAGVGGAFGYAAYQRAVAGARGSKCVHNIRQVGLASLQYSDDKRFLPHVLKYRDYDGDRTSDHASRAMGSLIYYGYLDRPEVLTCPVSEDRAYSGRFPDDPRDWDWSGRANPTPEFSPITAPGLAPRLDDSIELSFSWTRRGFGRSLMSTAILAADKSAADHGSGPGRYVLHGDATLSYLKEEEPERQQLEVLDRRGGCLSLLD